MLRLVFLDSSLESPGQEKHSGILFIPLHVVTANSKNTLASLKFTIEGVSTCVHIHTCKCYTYVHTYISLFVITYCGYMCMAQLIRLVYFSFIG